MWTAAVNHQMPARVISETCITVSTLAPGPSTVVTAASANSATISFFTRCTVPLPTPTSAATFRMPFPALRCLLMASSTFGDRASSPADGRDPGRPERGCV